MKAGDYIEMNMITFIMTSLIIVLLPGTSVIYTVSVGILEGSAKEWINRSSRQVLILQKCFGVAFIGFAMKLVLADV